jgi:hypothetical protein
LVFEKKAVASALIGEKAENVLKEWYQKDVQAKK